MNKAVIILMVIGGLSVLGGIVAFRAKTFRPPNGYTSYVTTNAAGAPTISCKLTLLCLTDQGIPTFTYTTVLSNGVCPVRVNTFREAACD